MINIYQNFQNKLILFQLCLSPSLFSQIPIHWGCFQQIQQIYPLGWMWEYSNDRFGKFFLICTLLGCRRSWEMCFFYFCFDEDVFSHIKPIYLPFFWGFFASFDCLRFLKINFSIFRLVYKVVFWFIVIC